MFNRLLLRQALYAITGHPLANESSTSLDDDHPTCNIVKNSETEWYSMIPSQLRFISSSAISFHHDDLIIQFLFSLTPDEYDLLF